MRDIEAMAVATDVKDYLENNPKATREDAIEAVLLDTDYSEEEKKDVAAFCAAIIEPND